MTEELKNFIYIGDGFHELETYEHPSYKWISDECVFYIKDSNIKSISLNIEHSPEIKIVEITGAIIEKHSENKIDINILDEVIKLKLNYFIPQIKHGTSDTRKLSFKLFSITLDNNITIPIDSILHIPSIFYNLTPIENDFLITEYGEYGEMCIKTSKNNINGKLNFNKNQTSFYSHRSGWNNVIRSLFELHNDNGIHFDGFLENTFVWKKNKLLASHEIPYKTNWVGIFHNPPNMPSWFSNNGGHANSILSDVIFKQSLTFCKGIYVLSQYHANYLKLMIPEIPINVLYHPTDIPDNTFTYDKFINNPNKCVINIGWWLRKLNSLFLLKSPYKKIQILPIDKCKNVVDVLISIEKTIYDIKITDDEYKSVECVDRLTNNAYDEILSKNIVYLNLYDSSANNAIIECIARGTPLLVNKLPAVVEYLGEDYPFYFTDDHEATRKLSDLNLIRQTHEYLISFENKKRILKETFINDFKNSSIYKNL